MPQVSLPDLAAKACSGEALISFPTDTVPALSVCPDRAGLLFAAKQRDREKPLILMAATIAELWSYVAGSAAEREILAAGRRSPFAWSIDAGATCQRSRAASDEPKAADDNWGASAQPFDRDRRSRANGSACDDKRQSFRATCPTNNG